MHRGEPPSHGGIRDGLRLFGQFLRRPGAVGAVVPSSAELAERITAAGDVERARVVVELGPGTGVVTLAVMSTSRVSLSVMIWWHGNVSVVPHVVLYCALVIGMNRL